MTIRTPQQHARLSADLLEELRGSAPLVHAITNTVVTNVTANVLLAIGASPAMVDIPAEAGPFARVASGLLINLGTPHAEQREAMIEAVDAANDAGTPWVLDPVAIGSLPVRTELAQRLATKRPTIVRGNASEIIALAGLGSGGRGVDSTDDADGASLAAELIADRHGSVVAVSGAVDLVTDGTTTVRVAGGHHWLTAMTGGGCALGAVIAAFASLSDDRLATTVAASAVYAVAAERAAAVSRGPGGFAVAFLDELSLVSADDVVGAAAIS